MSNICISVILCMSHTWDNMTRALLLRSSGKRDCLCFRVFKPHHLLCILLLDKICISYAALVAQVSYTLPAGVFFQKYLFELMNLRTTICIFIMIFLALMSNKFALLPHPRQITVKLRVMYVSYQYPLFNKSWSLLQKKNLSAFCFGIFRNKTMENSIF